jgi:hypothetical protein
MDDYQKLCDTNKKVTKMRVIIMGAYCTASLGSQNWIQKI